jgi:hypothetical protein
MMTFRPFQLVLLLILLLLAGCTTQFKQGPIHLVQQGEYGKARAAVRKDLEPDRKQRSYLLDRMRLAILTLDDGYPAAAQTTLEDIYDILRTQGINRDKTVSSVVLNEDLKFWKGEPFEQAMMMVYYGLQQASLGSWDNARAAADNSLFKLRDFSDGKKVERINTLEIAQRAAEVERTRNDPAAGEQYLNSGYAVRESNFTLGYLLAGIANQQLNRQQEASDFFAVAMQIAPSLRSLVDELREGRYNTVLVVAYGLGPRKEGYGPDNALAEFVPRYRSDARRLIVQTAGQTATYPLVTDLNAMAADHMWNNLEDVREAKSHVGTGLLIGGAAATGYGLYSDDPTVALIGLGVMAAGAFAKAGAHADTRYCDIMPQRVFVAPLNLDDPDAAVTLQLEGEPGTRLVLAGMSRPSGAEAQLRYVRLVSPPPSSGFSAPAWATSGQLFYATPHTGAIQGDNLPYILGGRSALPPTQAALDAYHRSGNLRGLTVNDLAELHRAEKLVWTIEDQNGFNALHVLEGGRSLVSPLPGTAGYARLFGQTWPAYQPRSEQVRQFLERRN